MQNVCIKSCGESAEAGVSWAVAPIENNITLEAITVLKVTFIIEYGSIWLQVA